MNAPHFTVVTDGSCGSQEGGDIGAWCAVVVSAAGRKVLYGCTYRTTTSRCELTPIIESLRYIRSLATDSRGVRVRVISDSQYTIKTLAGEYPMHKNEDLWDGLEAVRKGLEVQYIWRSRNTHDYMTYCDAVCSLLRHRTKVIVEELVGSWRDAGDLLQEVELPQDTDVFKELNNVGTQQRPAAGETV